MADPFLRPNLRVVARILEALLREGGPMRRTPLQQASGTNYTQFSRYLDLLVQRGLLATETNPDGAVSIRLTPKGYEAYRFLVEAIRRL